MVFIEKNGKGYKRGGEDEETVTSGYTHSSVLSYQRFKAESEAQRGKSKSSMLSALHPQSPLYMYVCMADVLYTCIYTLNHLSPPPSITSIHVSIP